MKYKSIILAFLFYCFFFALSAQTPSELKFWLPNIEGWSVSDKVEVFSPENLFDRINGAAPLYLENNFREMTSMEYTKGDDYITIQAYRHAAPEDAFGMYASERSTDLKFLPFAGEAQGDDMSIFFFAGNIYVKMWTSSTNNIGEVLQTVAEGLAKKIDADAKYPLIVQSFPEDRKIDHSETYITSNYIGHEFLKAVYTAKYTVNDQSFQLFVIDAKTRDNAKELLNKYYTFTKQPLGFEEGNLTVKDRYNGDIPAIWNGQYLIGLFSEDGKEILGGQTYLENLSKNLANLQILE